MLSEFGSMLQLPTLSLLDLAAIVTYDTPRPMPKLADAAAAAEPLAAGAQASAAGGAAGAGQGTGAVAGSRVGTGAAAEAGVGTGAAVGAGTELAMCSEGLSAAAELSEELHLALARALSGEALEALGAWLRERHAATNAK